MRTFIFLIASRDVFDSADKLLAAFLEDEGELYVATPWSDACLDGFAWQYTRTLGQWHLIYAGVWPDLPTLAFQEMKHEVLRAGRSIDDATYVMLEERGEALHRWLGGESWSDALTIP